jgi:hypothetical protein
MAVVSVKRSSFTSSRMGLCTIAWYGKKSTMSCPPIPTLHIPDQVSKPAVIPGMLLVPVAVPRLALCRCLSRSPSIMSTIKVTIYLCR